MTEGFPVLALEMSYVGQAPQVFIVGAVPLGEAVALTAPLGRAPPNERTALETTTTGLGPEVRRTPEDPIRQRGSRKGPTLSLGKIPVTILDLAGETVVTPDGR